jgi:hypothetical protein
MKMIYSTSAVELDDTILKPQEPPVWDGSGEQLELPFPYQKGMI